ncbi:COX15/CtaA family protein [Iamia sp.]|uniref:COX15/CtaA family protein n=1 Tax=Iamia sp. TaxID=2722710 RepID=UPI002BB13EC3|nr:COX15/CtaA family protein [Iamia sp.]HXH56666.1 COX15/CtaA family protein [Iamia sp.]
MAVLDRAPVLSPLAYRRITLVALWSLVFIVVTGAGVRLTGSGLGCSSWPGCEPGELIPRGESSWNPWIEFANRLITGAVSVAVALAVLGSRRRLPRRRDLTLLSWGLVVGVLAQILLGALVVSLHVHPVVVQGHFLLSAVLVANAVVLHHRAARPDGPDGTPGATTPMAGPTVVRLARVAVAVGAIVMLAGTLVTGAGPHAGDADAERLSIAVRSVAMVHSGLTWVFLAVVVVLVVRMQREMVGAVAMERARVLLTVVVLQGGLGYLQYLTGVPELLVGLHVLGSMLVWAAVLRLLLVLAEPLAATGRQPVAVGAPSVAPPGVPT